MFGFTFSDHLDKVIQDLLRRVYPIKCRSSSSPVCSFFVLVDFVLVCLIIQICKIKVRCFWLYRYMYFTVVISMLESNSFCEL